MSTAALKESRARRVFTILCGTLAVCAIDAQAQTAGTTDQLSREAILRVRTHERVVPWILDVQRDVVVSTGLIDLQVVPLLSRPGAIDQARPRAIHCFRVLASNWEIVDGKIVNYGVSLADPQSWLLAFDESSTTWFHLQGFPQASTDFNRLVLLLNITADDTAVNRIAGTYQRMVKPPGYVDLIVRNEMDLLWASKLWFSADEEARRFDRWWSTTPDRRRDLSWTRTTLANGDRRVSWYVLKGLDLIRESIIVHRNGTITEETGN